jgi:holo-[acyl-carrier protein] synthase
VEVGDVAQSIARFGDRYLHRLFTKREISTCQESSVLASQRFATRFAAKEATFKVLRPPHGWLDLRDIEIETQPDGAPALVLTGEALQLARDAGLGSFSVSLSHQGAYATAVVVALRTSRGIGKGIND